MSEQILDRSDYHTDNSFRRFSQSLLANTGIKQDRLFLHRFKFINIHTSVAIVTELLKASKIQAVSLTPRGLASSRTCKCSSLPATPVVCYWYVYNWMHVCLLSPPAEANRNFIFRSRHSAAGQSRVTTRGWLNPVLVHLHAACKHCTVHTDFKQNCISLQLFLKRIQCSSRLFPRCWDVLTNSTFQQVKKFHALWNPKAVFYVHVSLPFAPVLDHLKLIYILTSYFCTIFYQTIKYYHKRTFYVNRHVPVTWHAMIGFSRYITETL